MRLYIVRHAIAVAHGTPGFEEDNRPLTEEGIEKMRRAAKGLRKMEVLPHTILCSPLPRAHQTAEILLEELGGKTLIKLTDALAPSGNRREVFLQLQALRTLEQVMLVGHQPSLGEIAGEIAWGSPEHYVELKKGGACRIDIVTLRPKPRGALIWIVTPSILRSQG